MQQLQTTQAASVWSYFLKICAIAHPSRHEKALVEWIFTWAKEHNISCKQDHVGNLILHKPASAGYEEKTPVILQAHLDMVPQKNSDKVHDFTTDPITPIIDGEWMHADNTTLGADNGIGMSSCLAVLASNEIAHGPLEVLLTTSEEIGMVGAFGLEPNLFDGKILINTDSEQEGDIYIGCAGGIRVYTDLPYQQVAVKSDHVSYEVALTGLKGGHSGCDIDLLRGNAITLLANALVECTDIPYDLCSMDGGSLRNAIPREARATIASSQTASDWSQQLQGLTADIQAEYRTTDPSLSVSFHSADAPDQVLSSSTAVTFLSALDFCPNGIDRMSPDIEGLVQTSNNVARISLKAGAAEVHCLTRSSVDTEKMDLARRIRGDRHCDYRDLQPKDGSETFLQLPYSNDAEKMKMLRAQVARM